VPGKGTDGRHEPPRAQHGGQPLQDAADGDIIVPIRTVAVIGTTDVSVPDPDVYGITPERSP